MALEPLLGVALNPVMAGKNLVEHHEQLQDYDGKWHPLKTERPAGSMRHFRTGPSNSGFQPRRSRSKEELGASCGSRWRLSRAGIATTESRSTTYCAAHRAGLWQQPPSRNRQKTRPSSRLAVGVASESRLPQNRVIAMKGKSWEKTMEDACLLQEHPISSRCLHERLRHPSPPAPDSTNDHAQDKHYNRGADQVQRSRSHQSGPVRGNVKGGEKLVIIGLEWESGRA